MIYHLFHVDVQTASSNQQNEFGSCNDLDRISFNISTVFVFCSWFLGSQSNGHDHESEVKTVNVKGIQHVHKKLICNIT